jgi:hypothetical protein
MTGSYFAVVRFEVGSAWWKLGAVALCRFSQPDG